MQDLERKWQQIRAHCAVDVSPLGKVAPFLIAVLADVGSKSPEVLARNSVMEAFLVLFACKPRVFMTGAAPVAWHQPALVFTYLETLHADYHTRPLGKREWSYYPPTGSGNVLEISAWENLRHAFHDLLDLPQGIGLATLYRYHIQPSVAAFAVACGVADIVLASRNTPKATGEAPGT